MAISDRYSATQRGHYRARSRASILTLAAALVLSVAVTLADKSPPPFNEALLLQNP